MERKDWSMYALQGSMQSLTDRPEARVIAAGREVRLGTEVWRVERTMRVCRVDPRPLEVLE